MRIQTKLLLSFLLASALLLVAIYFVLQWSIDRGVLNYVNERQAEQFAPLVEKLEQHYAQEGDWQVLAAQPRMIYEWTHEIGIRPLGPAAGPGRGGRNHDGADRRPPRDRAGPPGRERPSGRSSLPGKQPGHERGRRSDDNAIGLLDADKVPIIESDRKAAVLLPVQHQGRTVAWLSLKSSNRLASDYELKFLQQQQETIFAVCMGIALLALLLAYPLARNFTQPLVELERSTSRLAAGNFRERIELNRKDEFGSLGRSFNELALTLEDNEASRKRWLADTSHELRTPLAIIRAQLTAMQDGVRALSEAEIGVALSQVEHLQQLMDDLHELSNADIGGLRYNKRLVDISELIQEAVESHLVNFQEKNISIDIHLPIEAIVANIDPSRIHQLLDNILANSLKYTDQGGRAELSCSIAKDDGRLHIVMQDSAPGVSADQHEKIFDHLYRVESSRNRATGGSGLGLAICRRIVEAHDGHIAASASPLGGLKVDISLPLENS